MPLYNDETEFTDIHMIQKVVGLFEHKPQMQRIITCGLFGIEYDPELDPDDFERWTGRRRDFNEPFADDRLGANSSRASGSAYQSPLHYYSVRDNTSPAFYKVQEKESDSERKARLLQEAKKSKEKAEKKRLKKQKRKQRKQMEKEKQNPGKPGEGDGGEQSKPEESKSVNDQEKKDSAAAKEADSDGSSCSGQESSDEEEDAKNDSDDLEELDMTSTFVSKAAVIAQRKLEQNSKSERREKKKAPEKKSPGARDKTPESKAAVKELRHKDSAVPSGPSLEDNVKISTDLAIIGNKFASEGDYSMAVKYFTDAIKYNPKEFKLFGNRSFCFEKMLEYEKALADAELSLSVSPGWIKGLFRKGRALAGLKRYEEAADAFRDVLKRDGSYAEAAQELMRVQIIQLMAYGFTREQSSNALIIHGTVDKAFAVLSKLHHPPGPVLNGPPPPTQVANVTGTSPVLSANSNPHQASNKKPALSNPLGPSQNIPKPAYHPPMKINNSDNRTPLELFPVWVGNLDPRITEAAVSKLFSRAGPVFSVKLLSIRRCAFVNFTRQEHCDEAIRRFHGFDLHGLKLAVRYPDRIPPGMGISRSALRACDLEDENVRM
ncbi:hsp70-Hsp90 organizing protein 1 [Fundulus heteroclitus]|uniref:hsp70-Hsp90 organizing protein 1 n=1 Tax=Fundulus heteroclitus TaxID=8078 RepID=UPI00165B734A|nr:hsp70-Hsp90 organizing protein 1 [Fundulus heteroclitus]